ncbi:cation:proton antiporter [Patescibacteria group bacterium]
MEQEIILGLSLILVLGGAAQWLAWRFHFPSILLLLIVGFIAGPVTGVIQPEKLIGEGLFAFISLAVAVILFEGGLSLRFSQIKGVGKVVRNLIGIGLLVTWLLSAAAAMLFLDLDWRLALLLGAVLTVSGPTVIIPILRHIRPSPKIGSVLRWEGILVDSLGALLAIIVFEGITRSAGGGFAFTFMAIVKTVLIGGGSGLLAAGFIVLVLKRYWIPDFLHVSVALMTVITVFLVDNRLQLESGLLAVTVMGIALINQRKVSVEHIVEFKENLRTLLISALFITLAARLHISDLQFVNVGSVLFILALLLVVRPIVVALSTRNSEFTMKERAFLATVYPRGIVAAAVASIFAVRLLEMEYPGAESFEPLAFIAVAGTVAVYGLFSLPLARRLGVASPNPQGVLLIGADYWIRKTAIALQDAGVTVKLVDDHWVNVNKAKQAGLSAEYVQSFHEFLADEVELGDIGHVLAMSSSDELNSMVTLHLIHAFGRKNVYQLTVDVPNPEQIDPTAPQYAGRFLFGPTLTFQKLDEQFALGADIQSTDLTAEYTYADFVDSFVTGSVVPLFHIDANNKVTVATADPAFNIKGTGRLIALVRI